MFTSNPHIYVSNGEPTEDDLKRAEDRCLAQGQTSFFWAKCISSDSPHVKAGQSVIFVGGKPRIYLSQQEAKENSHHYVYEISELVTVEIQDSIQAGLYVLEDSGLRLAKKSDLYSGNQQLFDLGAISKRKVEEINLVISQYDEVMRTLAKWRV